MAQDFYTRFIYETVNADKLQQMDSLVRNYGSHIKEVDEATKTWTRTIQLLADKHQLTYRQAEDALKSYAREQERAAEVAKKAAQETDRVRQQIDMAYMAREREKQSQIDAMYRTREKEIAAEAAAQRIAADAAIRNAEKVAAAQSVAAARASAASLAMDMSLFGGAAAQSSAAARSAARYEERQVRSQLAFQAAQQAIARRAVGTGWGGSGGAGEAMPAPAGMTGTNLGGFGLFGGGTIPGSVGGGVEEAAESKLSQVFGRVGGRVAGAELGKAIGLPGGGFIGSQLAYGLGVSGGAALGLLGAGVGLFGAFELGKQAQELAKYAQEQRNLAKELNLTSGEMATFSAIAAATGTHLEGAVKQVGNLTDELEKGGPRAREITTALSELGLGKSTAYQDSAKGLEQIAAALAKIPDQAQRLRIATDLLKDQGRTLADLSSNLPALEKALHVDDGTIDRLAMAEDKLGRIWQHIKNLSMLGLAKVLPGGGDVNTEMGTWGGTPGPHSDLSKLGWRLAPNTTISNGKVVPVLTPEEKSRRDDVIKQLRTQFGTPEDRARGKLDNVTQDVLTLESKYRSGEVSDESYRTSFAAYMGDKESIEAERKREQEAQRQRERLQDLIKQPITTPEEALRLAARLPKEFPELIRRVVGKDGSVTYAGDATARSFMQFLLPVAYSGIVSGAGRQRTTDLQHLDREFDEERRKVTSDYMRLGEEEKRDQDRLAREVYGVTSTDIQNQASIAAALNAGRATVAGGFSQYGMTGLAIRQRQFGLAGARSSQEYASQISSLRQRSAAATEAAGYAGTGDERERLLSDARKLETEARVKEIEALTQSIDRLNKFNESVDKAAEEVNKQISGGITSILMGAQHGAMRGQAGRGALDALRGFFEQQESAVLHGATSYLLDITGITGEHGLVSKVGSAAGGSAFLSKALGETVFRDIGNKKDAELIKNTAALQALTAQLSRGVASGVSVSGGSGGIIVGPGGMPVPITTDQLNASIAGQVAGATLPDFIATVGAAGGIAAAGAAVAGGAGISAQLARSGGNFSKLGSILGGAQFATTTAPWDLLQGRGNSDGTQVSISSGEAAGAIATQVGAAIGAYEGVRTITEGGARNAAGGIAMTLGAIAPFTGPAAPFVAAAAAVAGIVSSFLPDPRVTRSQDIQKKLFTSQYLAPPAWNVSEGSNAGYADTNFLGQVRTSNLSPYPVTADPYLDVPRRTDVPGHVISQFGGTGSGAPGAVVTPQQPITVHITAIDPASFHAVMVKNAGSVLDAVHHGLQSNFHPVVNTLRQQLGQS